MLLLVAHGTASPAGTATTERLVEAIAARRPDVPTRLCFLDVAVPRLAETLDTLDEPTIVVPLLLSTGYHVTTDIPAAVAGRRLVQVARHLGPHPLLAEAMADRIAETGAGSGGGSTLMVAAGSSQPAATEEITAAGELLAHHLGTPVSVCTMTDDLTAVLGSLAPPVTIAPYLLAEGTFTDRIAQVAGSGIVVAAPLGTHPAVASLVWQRYDEARRTAFD